ncbi:MAG: mycofactocin precursor MftA [Firmicutes bacterium]|nr:mycofactocin precursor MftA [Bacillota bacterium]
MEEIKKEQEIEADDEIIAEIEVEDLSIDGICGVY